jgi:FlaA1/EpsC-like NDP-sugar epimerase
MIEPVRPGVALLSDAAAWIGGVALAVWSRYDFELTGARLLGAITVGLLAVGVQAFLGHTQYLYRGRHGLGSFEEVRAVSLTAVGTIIAISAINVGLPARVVPASSPAIGGLLAMVLMLARRYVHRMHFEHRLRPRPGRAEPVLLFGAGTAGHTLTRAILVDPRSAYLPVGVLDDDPDKCHLRVHGVPMLGGRHDIPAIMQRTGARTVILAVANADAALVRDIRRICLDAEGTFKVVPSVAELLDGTASLADVRDVQVGDLLGRRQIDTDLSAVAGYLTGKRVLVTGAGGSIGSELCRQIRRFAPSELIMLDRDESALHAVELSLRGRALLDSADLVLADLRDADAIRAVFASRAPQVVFHAAALKHLPLLERYPGEAIRSNIWGTLTVLECCAGVETFVNISTDKAANPCSVLGYSKRITERLTADAAQQGAGTFLNVRFGNVLGSRGSVLTAFSAQAAAGGPITVTHPEVTRYFMTVQEAVQLVIQAAALGRDGEALVLDMGRPVRIADVAAHMAEQAPAPVDIVYTGLRPGEKLHEDLFAAGEQDRRPRHPLISHVNVPPLHPDQVRRLDPQADPQLLIAELARLCDATPASLTARITDASPTGKVSPLSRPHA